MVGSAERLGTDDRHNQRYGILAGFAALIAGR